MKERPNRKYWRQGGGGGAWREGEEWTQQELDVLRNIELATTWPLIQVVVSHGILVAWPLSSGGFYTEEKSMLCCCASSTPKAWPSSTGRPARRSALLRTVLEVCHRLGPARLMSTKFTVFFKEGEKKSDFFQVGS